MELSGKRGDLGTKDPKGYSRYAFSELHAKSLPPIYQEVQM